MDERQITIFDQIAQADKWREEHESSPLAIAADVAIRDALGLPPYGEPPPSTLETRGEAEVAIKPDRKRLQGIVYACIREHGPVTDQQICDLTGLAGNTTRPRRLELCRAGRIEPAGVSVTRAGRKAIAWRVVEI
jgi:hypothetical protein